jgi:hypothetical protein
MTEQLSLWRVAPYLTARGMARRIKSLWDLGSDSSADGDILGCDGVWACKQWINVKCK